METLAREHDSFSFAKNVLLIVSFFLITPITLGVTLFSLVSFGTAQKEANLTQTSYYKDPNSGVKVFASLPSNLPSISGTPEGRDARAEIIKNYLSTYNSPLLPYANAVVKAADKYGLDFRLITAIAQKESNLCKIIPPKSHNCWGWGITGESTLGFSSYEEAIDEVSRGLKEEYLDKGYQTIEKIMTKYTPLSNGSWAQGVNSFMKEME